MARRMGFQSLRFGGSVAYDIPAMPPPAFSCNAAQLGYAQPDENHLTECMMSMHSLLPVFQLFRLLILPVSLVTLIQLQK